MSVTLLLEDEIDISRGDIICHPGDAPQLARELEATVCWMTDAPLRAGARYAIKHATHAARVVVDEVVDHVDVHTLAPDADADAARPQRHRPRAPAHLQADGVRRLRAQSRDGLVHPHRRDDERHRRRRDEH